MQTNNEKSRVVQHLQLGTIDVVVQLLLVALALIFLVIQTALAQETPQTPGQEKSPAQEKATTRRIGINASKAATLLLQDAVKMALENNRDIEVERIKVQLDEYKVRAARGSYDPTVSTSLYYERQTLPVASLLMGGENGKLTTSDFVSTSTLSKRLPWQGASIDASFENYRSTNNNAFDALNPQFGNRVVFNFTQPLFRNRQIDAPRREIKIAKKRLDLSDSEFRQRVVEIISEVQHAYWQLVFARRDEEIKRESVELARLQLEHNQRKVDKGTLAPLDVISARVELTRRTDEAEAAVEAIQQAENALKTLLLQPNSSELWNAEILPAEQPQMDTEALMAYGDALKLALKNRPEMEQFRLREEINRTDVEYFRNQTKPQIDFIAGYSINGLAGKARAESNPIFSSTESLLARVNQLSALSGLAPLPAALTETVPGKLTGGYGQSLTNLLGQDYRTWRVGVNFNFSIGNHTAKANLGYALAEGKQIDAKRQRAMQTIEVEVRNALQAVEIARRRFDAARNSRLDAELQHQGEQRKFEAGLSTSFLVLDRQNAHSAARGRELKALTDYNKARVELQRALSTTLSSNNIALASR
jgi:HAE1 family hydrophobic/amphiphilic exporter-1